MIAKIDIEVSRETLTQMLAAYAANSCPSAVFKLVSDAFGRAGDSLAAKRPEDADFLRDFAARVHATHDAVREEEDRKYLAPAR